VSRRTFALIPIAALLVALITVPLPYQSEGPGPALEVEPLIRVHGPQMYQSEGKFVLTSVSFLPLTLFELIRTAADPNSSVVPDSALVFPGETSQHADLRALQDMLESKVNATYVVLSRLDGYPNKHGTGALVEAVGSGCPADGRLYPGDVIQRVNGTEVGDEATFERAVDSVPKDRPLTFHVTSAGRTSDVTLTRQPCAGSTKPLVGISTVPNFPFGVTMNSENIGGPSAGTMWALGLYDLLTPGDLAGGRIVAGTGTIDPTGKVGPIGGVQDKIRAAKGEGADVFLVPTDNYDEAKQVAGDLRLVPIATFQDALDYLQRGT
jgi:PDZ domain-containing protein